MSTVAMWTVDEVCAHLGASGLRGALVEKFRANEVDGATALRVTKADLKDELDITSLSDRKDVWAAVEGLQALAVALTPVRRPSTASSAGSPRAVRSHERIRELQDRARHDPVQTLDAEQPQDVLPYRRQSIPELKRAKATGANAPDPVRSLDAEALARQQVLLATPARAATAGAGSSRKSTSSSEAGTSPGHSSPSTPSVRRVQVTTTTTTTQTAPMVVKAVASPAPVMPAEPARCGRVAPKAAPPTVKQAEPVRTLAQMRAVPGPSGGATRVHPGMTARELYETTADYKRSAAVEDRILYERATLEYLEKDVLGAQEVMKTIHMESPVGNRGALSGTDRSRIATMTTNEPLAKVVDKVDPVTKLTTGTTKADYKQMLERQAEVQIRNDANYREHQHLMGQLKAAGVIA